MRNPLDEIKAFVRQERVHFTRHAIERLVLRRMTPGDVFQAILDASVSWQQTDEKFAVECGIRGQRAMFPIVIARDHVLIVTVMWRE